MQRHISVNLGNLLLSLSEITDIANPDITHHQKRTAFIAVEMATYGGADEQTIENIFAAALLHDVGAISVEEKTELHGLKEPYLDSASLQFHCIRGELLLNETPWFRQIAKAVRYHHTNYSDFEDTLENKDVYSGQVIYLADYVERLIDRTKYILFQNLDIIEKVKNLDPNAVHPEIVRSFLLASDREEFWLDLVSHRLYSVLQQNGPFRYKQIDINDIIHISKMYKNIIDFKSPFTATHTSGVAQCAQVLAEKFGLTGLEVNQMKVAGYLHDIGKLVIPNSILDKQGKLTPNEFAVIKSHTYYTYHAIHTIGGLKHIAQWAAYHHEKLDGTGYPFRCKEHEIGIGARIMTIADIFTAVTEDRPYRNGMTRNQVFKVLRKNVQEKKIDGNMVDLLLDHYLEVDESVKTIQSQSRQFYENKFLTSTIKKAPSTRLTMV